MNEDEAKNEHFYNYGILKKGEEDFLESLYNDSTVVIVGPSLQMMGSGLGEYIDSFDIVIRLNRSIPLNPELKDDIGTKVDVLYQTLTKLSKKTSVVEHMSIDAYERANLKAFVFPVIINKHRLANLRVYYDNNFKDNVERIPTRTINDFVTELKIKMGTGPNTGMVAIEHVLTYPVKKLFLCGFDFYDTYYYDGYGGVDNRKRKKCWINRGHDIAIHREYTASLYKDNDHVEIDEVMKNIFEREEDLKINELELKENGYTILKQIIPKEDIEMFRKTLSECGKNAFHDSINNPKFDSLTKVFTYDKLNAFLQTITDYSLIYGHHFDIFVGKHGSRWHEDTQAFHKNGYYKSRIKKYKEELGVCPHDMMEPLPNGDTYKIYRACIYLQDNQENESGGIAFYKGSHLDAKSREVVIPEIETGDVIVFDCRIIHKANGLPVENNNRMVMLFTVGKNNIFTEFHIKGAIKRQRKLAKLILILSDNVAKVLKQNKYCHNLEYLR